MSFIVNVHYKSDPEDLFWQYSGITHICLHDAVNELISAQKQPHIDKAIVVGSGTGQPIGNKDLLDKAVADVLIATENLITVNEKIFNIPVTTSYASNVYASTRDIVDNRGVKIEDILAELERVIYHLREDCK